MNADHFDRKLRSASERELELASRPVDPAERMERIERHANVTRSRLLRAIDALDHRRHVVQRTSMEVRRAAVPSLAIMMGVALVATAAFVVSRFTRRRRFAHRLARAIEELD